MKVSSRQKGEARHHEHPVVAKHLQQPNRVRKLKRSLVQLLMVLNRLLLQNQKLPIGDRVQLLTQRNRTASVISRIIRKS
ncbi:unnamed protein product, partial [Gongylonema pulchrum]|uniref:Transposase n=1 Tax=Gongylonema pulchrum TaxID=637853 RepID=A0A183ET88_9BILA